MFILLKDGKTVINLDTCKSISIFETYKDYDTKTYKIIIPNINVNNIPRKPEYYELGSYDTKEEAMNVLINLTKTLNSSNFYTLP
jgi:hypothetical protein